MKNTLFVLFAVVILSAGCTKKTTNETGGDKNSAGRIETVEFKCDGMHCSGCEETITAEVSKLDGVSEIKADAKAKFV
ncbi:MAG: cation transporter, partial [Ignavibacteria bacterium]|nr:cation transporter [Ignavibacteria bacterium]